MKKCPNIPDLLCSLPEPAACTRGFMGSLLTTFEEEGKTEACAVKCCVPLQTDLCAVATVWLGGLWCKEVRITNLTQGGLGKEVYE